MKKLIALLMTASMFICMTACKDKIPNGMSQELYDTSVNALKIMDKYNDMDINADDAYDRLNGLYDKLDNMNFSGTESSQALLIKTYILSYTMALRNYTTSDTYTIADELREQLELD